MRLLFFTSLFGLILSFSVGLRAEDAPGVDITVTIPNVPGAKGSLRVGLYDSAATFVKKPLPQSVAVAADRAGQFVVTLSGVTPGRYAIVVIHDLNNNGKLDKNLFGMPKEPLAFSNDPEIPRGVPAFDQCAFDVTDQPIALTISLILEE
ncbi:MAG: DUF2141 domain-containing protein [Verrucomicrobiota bacterium]